MAITSFDVETDGILEISPGGSSGVRLYFEADSDDILFQIDDEEIRQYAIAELGLEETYE
ncbi:MAG: hypothetical protein LBE03_01155 [Candidatus Nomurabacteria bacterium]|jgi:hypothetical protein|nr:hypothetical protein [Candidatus Nomurabacteria bacterium]